MQFYYPTGYIWSKWLYLLCHESVKLFKKETRERERECEREREREGEIN